MVETTTVIWGNRHPISPPRFPTPCFTPANVHPFLFLNSASNHDPTSPKSSTIDFQEKSPWSASPFAKSIPSFLRRINHTRLLRSEHPPIIPTNPSTKTNIPSRPTPSPPSTTKHAKNGSLSPQVSLKSNGTSRTRCWAYIIRQISPNAPRTYHSRIATALRQPARVAQHPFP